MILSIRWDTFPNILIGGEGNVSHARHTHISKSQNGTCEGDFGDVSMIHPRKTKIIGGFPKERIYGDFGDFG